VGELGAEPLRRYARRVLLVLPEYDYGRPERGPSSDRHFWVPAAEAVIDDCHVLWNDPVWHQGRVLDRELLETVDRIAPDLVWFVPFRDDTAPETLTALMRRTTTVAFFCDDQWRFDDYSSRYAQLYTHVVTTEPTAVGRYRALGGNAILTNWAGRLVGPVRAPLGPHDHFRYDVSFVGQRNTYRAWFVNHLQRSGIAVECFGADWPNGRLGYQEMEDVFRGSRINLNISNSRQYDTRYLLDDPANYLENRETVKNAEQIKARHFEIAMAGGCQLSNYPIGLEESLSIGTQIAIYATPDDCVAQVRRLLNAPEQRSAMAHSAWRRALREHTFERRLASILAAIWPSG
jgi:spore maturation protein CgeB